MESPQINSDSDYRRALARADVLMDAAPGTAEFEELRELAPLIEAWEREHFPIAPTSPSAALKFRADQLGYTVTRRAVARASGMLKFAPAKKAAARPAAKKIRLTAGRKAARVSGRRALRRAARKRK